jgi:hypothetical protein
VHFIQQKLNLLQPSLTSRSSTITPFTLLQAEPSIQNPGAAFHRTIPKSISGGSRHPFKQQTTPFFHFRRFDVRQPANDRKSPSCRPSSIRQDLEASKNGGMFFKQ